MYEPLDPSMTFAKAAELLINSRTMSPASRARYISPRTLSDLGQYIHALTRKFGEVPLQEIHVGLLREYQQERAETCGPNKINQELGTLVRIMRRAVPAARSCRTATSLCSTRSPTSRAR
jgi:hypothetical protein